MGRIILAAGLAIVALGVATPAEAQISFGFGNSNGGGSITLGGGRGISGGMRVGNNFGMTIGGGGGGGWRPSRPSRPVHVGPTRVTHYNPWTGRVDTHNNQINNTAFDFGRNQSMNNGTRRVVNRPVRDAWGNITGYERGVVWNNSFTGQEHGETTIVRPNGTGGGSSTTIVRSAPVSGGTGTTTVSRSYSMGRP